MSPGRWEEIERLYNSALEVESGRSRIERFIESPALRVAAKSLATDRTRSKAGDLVGHTLTHYCIVEKIGVGGMGDVYRARDDRLGRDVAIKVLPPEFVTDPERKKRFIHEAKAASALNHPNIITVY